MEHIFETVILLYQNTFLQYCLHTFKTVMVLYTHVIFEKKIYVCRERDVPDKNMGMRSVPFTPLIQSNDNRRDRPLGQK